MIDPPSLQALSAVLSTGSFDAAARQLNITQSAVSQRIKGLEEQLGATLIKRTRPAQPTEAGRKVLAHAEATQLLERELATSLGQVAEPATLRIAVTADSLATWVIGALAETDGLLFDLVIDDQDHSAELLRSGEVIGAITANPRPVPGCDALPVHPLRYVGFASPGFAARYFAAGLTPDAFRKAPAITFNRKDRLQRDWAADVCGARVALPTHFIGSSHAITHAARAGLGWAVNPETLVAPYFADGSLLRLAPHVPLETPLFWQVPRQFKAALAPVTAALKRAGATIR